MDTTILVTVAWLLADRLLWFGGGLAVGLALEWRWHVVDRLLAGVCRWNDCERR